MKNRDSKRNETAPPACWLREAQAACLLLELPSGKKHILAYAHFVAASLERGEKVSETLRITFTGFDIEIDGHRMTELLLNLQDLAVKWVRTVPAHYLSWAGDNSAVVTDIRVHSARNDSRPTPAGT